MVCYIDYLELIMVLGIFFYLYKAMRNFYRQRRAKTVFKFLLYLFFTFTYHFAFVFTLYVLYSLV